MGALRAEDGGSITASCRAIPEEMGGSFVSCILSVALDDEKTRHVGAVQQGQLVCRSTKQVVGGYSKNMERDSASALPSNIPPTRSFFL